MAKRESKINKSTGMESNQYTGLVNLMDANQKHLSELISIGLNNVGHEIREMKDTIREHNGRLRDNEKLSIQTEERMKVLQEGLAGQVGFCEKNVLKIKKLEKLNNVIGWVSNNPYKFTGGIVTVVGAILTIATVLNHLIS